MEALGGVIQTAGDAYETYVPQSVRDTLKAGGQFLGDAAEAVSRATNISPILTGEATAAAVTGGASKAGSLAVKGGRKGLKALKKADLLAVPSNSKETYVVVEEEHQHCQLRWSSWCTS